MKKICATAFITFKLLCRSGAFPLMALLTAATAAAVFASARADGEMLNEVRIRMRYSLYAVTALLHVAVIYTACTSLAGDIELRHFHVLSSAPVHRSQLWLGKFTGFLFAGLLVFVVGLGTVFAACALITRNCSDDEEILLKEKFYRVHHRVYPMYPDIEDQTRARFLGRKKELEELEAEHNGDTHEKDTGHEHRHDSDHEHDHSLPDWMLKKSIFQDIRNEIQMVKPHGSKSWLLPMNTGRSKSDYLLLRFKCYSDRKKEKFSGQWILAQPAGKEIWAGEFSGYPYIRNEIRIPVPELSDLNELELTFKSSSSSHLVFPMKNGIALLCDDGPLLKNIAGIVAGEAMVLSVLIALALALGSYLTYTVSIFLSFSVYFISILSGTFLSAMKFYFYGESGFVYMALHAAVSAAMKLDPPAFSRLFADGISIDFRDFIPEWGAQWAVLVFVFVLFGLVTITGKEIDKIPQA